MDGQTLQPKVTDRGRMNSQLQDLQRQEGGEKCLWNLSDPLQGMTHQGAAERAPTPGPNENYRNPLREAKYQRELLKDYFNHVGGIGWAGGQDLRCVNYQHWR